MLSYKRSLPLKFLYRKGNSDILQYLPQSDHFFSGSVRSGLLDVIDSLNLSAGDIVLLSSFVAHGLILPFQRKKIAIEYYRLTMDLDPDLVDISNKIRNYRNKIRVIVRIHYFGNFKKSIFELVGICKEQGIILLEDCVHGLFSKDDSGNPIGSSGDIAFFSLPKSLPVPDGAIFFINNKAITVNLQFKRSGYSNISCSFHLVFLLLKRFENRFTNYYLASPVRLLNKVLYGIYYYFLCKVKGNTKISSVSNMILKNLNYAEIIERKTYIYNYFREKLLDSVRFSLLVDKHESAHISSGYPLLLSGSRDKLIHYMRRNGIELLSYNKFWNFIPDKNNFEIENKIINNHVLLPINNEFSDKEVAFIVNSLNSYFDEDSY